MAGIRRLIRARWLGHLLPIGVAYLLALQAVIVSVGLGMSAASPFGQADFDVCSAAVAYSPAPPESDGDRSDHRPQCPFCLVAAQSAGHTATIGSMTAFPAFAELPAAAPPYAVTDGGTVVSCFHRKTGDPRAPPQFSV